MENKKYNVQPFSGPGYFENSRHDKEGYSPCAICGKMTSTEKAKHWAVVINGGADWGDENSDQNDSGYMGGFPVGSDCHRKHVIKNS